MLTMIKMIDPISCPINLHLASKNSNVFSKAIGISLGVIIPKNTSMYPKLNKDANSPNIIDKTSEKYFMAILFYSK